MRVIARMREWTLVLVVLAGVGAAGCGYNTIQTYDEQVSAAASQIKVQLQRRADLIPNLVETVKAYAKQEQTVFTEVAEARAKLAGAVQSGDLQQMAQANAQLTAPLGRLLAIAENYPQLKSNENFRALQDQLEGTENRIAVARQDYNEAVNGYNAYIRRFPQVLTAKERGKPSDTTVARRWFPCRAVCAPAGVCRHLVATARSGADSRPARVRERPAARPGGYLPDARRRLRPAPDGIVRSGRLARVVARWPEDRVRIGAWRQSRQHQLRRLRHECRWHGARPADRGYRVRRAAHLVAGRHQDRLCLDSRQRICPHFHDDRHRRQRATVDGRPVVRRPARVVAGRDENCLRQQSRRRRRDLRHELGRHEPAQPDGEPRGRRWARLVAGRKQDRLLLGS